MPDGRRLGGVEFINPFTTEAAARLEPGPRLQARPPDTKKSNGEQIWHDVRLQQD